MTGERCIAFRNVDRSEHKKNTNDEQTYEHAIEQHIDTRATFNDDEETSTYALDFVERKYSESIPFVLLNLLEG